MSRSSKNGGSEESGDREVEDTTAGDLFDSLSDSDGDSGVESEEVYEEIAGESPEEIIESADEEPEPASDVDDDLLMDEGALDDLLLSGRIEEDGFLWVDTGDERRDEDEEGEWAFDFETDDSGDDGGDDVAAHERAAGVADGAERSQGTASESGSATGPDVAPAVDAPTEAEPAAVPVEEDGPTHERSADAGEGSASTGDREPAVDVERIFGVDGDGDTVASEDTGDAADETEGRDGSEAESPATDAAGLVPFEDDEETALETTDDEEGRGLLARLSSWLSGLF